MGINKWFSNVGLAEMWRRDFEGGMVAGFLVVEKYSDCIFFFFPFLLFIYLFIYFFRAIT